MHHPLKNESYRLVEKIEKGWSDDSKYYVETNEGTKLLIRQTALSGYKQKVTEFAMLKKLAKAGFHTNQPIELISCEDEQKLYMIMSWCEGEDAEDILPSFSRECQYELGVVAGKMLLKLHEVPYPPLHQDWQSFYLAKTNRKIEQYLKCGVRFEGADLLMEYLRDQQDLLKSRPQCFHHGDFHIGNMIINSDQELHVIDFNRQDVGDPWEEFNRITFSARVSPEFASGQIDGYFNGKPPEQFFATLAFYISTNTIASIPWSIPFGSEEVNFAKQQAVAFVEWFKAGLTPAWYRNHLDRL